MRLREGRGSHLQRGTGCLVYVCLCGIPAFLSCLLVDGSTSGALAPTVGVVTSPLQFQLAVRNARPQIVINEHLDMTGTPGLTETTFVDFFVPSSTGAYTRTIRGNCTGPPPISDLDPSLNLNSRQCLIIVRDDFLEFPLAMENSQVWLSNLYITMPGWEKIHSTLIGVHGGDMYLTDMAFVANGDKARAIHVKENGRVYVGNSHFSRFSNDKDGVIRLEAGARATIRNSEFLTNAAVVTGKPDVVAAGPVMGLYAGLDSDLRPASGSAAWFHNCRFDENTASVSGEVSVQDRSCRVYSNTHQPGVWDLDLRREVSVWPLVPDGGTNRDHQANVFEDGESARSAFLRPSDDGFVRIQLEHERDTRLPVSPIYSLPEGNEFITRDPYIDIIPTPPPPPPPPPTMAIIVGLSLSGMLCVLAIVCCVYVRKKRVKKREALVSQHSLAGPKRSNSARSRPADYQRSSEQHLVVQGSTGGTPSPYSGTGGTHVSTVTLSDTHGFTLAPVPPPAAGADRRQRMEYVQHQLDTLGNQPFLNGLVVEPGASNRMQGGQAVIQFVKDHRTGLHYAVKFFLSTTAFADECRLYTNPDSPLGKFLPALRNIVDGSAAEPLVVDGHGQLLPPCIVMEKGESLDVWMQRNRDGIDMITGLQVIQHVAERLSDLHNAGYVHRDLKLSNIMWLPRENRWTLIDFGCAACIGSMAPLAYSLQYAPPEVVRAAEIGCQSIQAQSSMDAWSLGMVAWELFCKQAALSIFERKDVTIARILGKKPLPWEDKAEGAQQRLQQLGRFRPAVLGLLQRDEAARLAIPDFISRCRRVIEETRGPPPSGGRQVQSMK